MSQNGKEPLNIPLSRRALPFALAAGVGAAQGMRSRTPHVPPILENVTERSRIFTADSSLRRYAIETQDKGKSRYEFVRETFRAYQPANVPVGVWKKLAAISHGIPAQESRYNTALVTENRAIPKKTARGAFQITEETVDTLNRHLQAREARRASTEGGVPNPATRWNTTRDPLDFQKAVQMIPQIYDLDVYPRIKGSAEAAAAHFGLDQDETNSFAAYCLIGGYHAGPGVINQLLRKSIQLYSIRTLFPAYRLTPLSLYLTLSKIWREKNLHPEYKDHSEQHLPRTLAGALALDAQTPIEDEQSLYARLAYFGYFPTEQYAVVPGVFGGTVAAVASRILENNPKLKRRFFTGSVVGIVAHALARGKFGALWGAESTHDPARKIPERTKAKKGQGQKKADLPQPKTGPKQVAETPRAVIQALDGIDWNIIARPPEKQSFETAFFSSNYLRNFSRLGSIGIKKMLIQCGYAPLRAHDLQQRPPQLRPTREAQRLRGVAKKELLQPVTLLQVPEYIDEERGGEILRWSMHGVGTNSDENREEYRYIAPESERALRLISTRFQKKLAEAGLDRKYKVGMVITSLLRDVARNRGTVGSSASSPHPYGFGIDISTQRFVLTEIATGKTARLQLTNNETAPYAQLIRQCAMILGNALMELHAQNALFLTNEGKAGVARRRRGAPTEGVVHKYPHHFHITPKIPNNQ